ncbi:MAG: transposase [Chloroflexi bacterium]|nr:MAG: transposase [Chloroflexota bacterium]
MQKVQKTYTPEFKREAVRLAQTSGKSMRLTDEVRLLHLS